MTIHSGWFVLYQPKYKTPSVFDLHERGLFTSMPYVTEKSGVSLIKIFGDQKIIRGRISLMNLVDHKILFEKHE